MNLQPIPQLRRNPVFKRPFSVLQLIILHFWPAILIRSCCQASSFKSWKCNTRRRKNGSYKLAGQSSGVATLYCFRNLCPVNVSKAKLLAKFVRMGVICCCVCYLQYFLHNTTFLLVQWWNFSVVCFDFILLDSSDIWSFWRRIAFGLKVQRVRFSGI